MSPNCTAGAAIAPPASSRTAPMSVRSAASAASGESATGANGDAPDWLHRYCTREKSKYTWFEDGKVGGTVGAGTAAVTSCKSTNSCVVEGALLVSKNYLDIGRSIAV